MIELLLSGVAVTLGFVAYRRVRPRRRREQAITVGLVVAASGVACVFWATAPPGFAGLPHFLIWVPLMCFALPAGVAAAVMEFEHRRRSRNGD